MSKIVFIGQAPSRTAQVPWTGHAGRRLADLMGVSQEEMLRLFEFRNLLDSYPGKGKGGDLFDRKAGRESAKRMFPSLIGRRVVLLGYHVHMAFKPFLVELGQINLTLHCWYVPGTHGMSVSVVPHPSGINRWYNDPNNRRDASSFLRSLVAVSR